MNRWHNNSNRGVPPYCRDFRNGFEHRVHYEGDQDRNGQVFNRWRGAAPMDHQRNYDIPTGRLRNRWDQRPNECYPYNSVNSNHIHVASEQPQSASSQRVDCGHPIPHKQAWSQSGNRSSLQGGSFGIPVPRTFTECSVPALQKHLVFNTTASKSKISSAMDRENVSCAVGMYGSNTPPVAMLAKVSSDYVKGSCISSPTEWHGSTCNSSALGLPSSTEQSESSISTSRMKKYVTSTSTSPRKQCASKIPISPRKQFSSSISPSPREQSDRLNISTSQSGSSVFVSPKETSEPRISASPRKPCSPNVSTSPRKQFSSDISSSSRNQSDISTSQSGSSISISPKEPSEPSISASPRKQFNSSISPPREQSDRLNISTSQSGSSISISPKEPSEPGISASPRKQFDSSISPPREQSDRLNISTLQSGSSISISPKEPSEPSISASPRKQFNSSISPPREQSDRLNISASQSGSSISISPKEPSEPSISASPRKPCSPNVSTFPRRQSHGFNNIPLPQSGSSISLSPNEHPSTSASPSKQGTPNVSTSPGKPCSPNGSTSPMKACSPNVSASPRKLFSSDISSPSRDQLIGLNISTLQSESSIFISPKEQSEPSILASPRKHSRSSISSPLKKQSGALTILTPPSKFSISNSPLEQSALDISVSPSTQAKPIISVLPREQMECDISASEGNFSTSTKRQSGTTVQYTSENCKLSNATKSSVPMCLFDHSEAHITRISTFQDNNHTTSIIEEVGTSRSIPQTRNIECICAVSPEKQIDPTLISQNNETGSTNIFTPSINQIETNTFSHEQTGLCLSSSSSKTQTESNSLTPQIKQTLLNLTIISKKQTALNVSSDSTQSPSHYTMNPQSEGTEPLNQMILNHEPKVYLPTEQSEITPTALSNTITNSIDHKNESNGNKIPVSLQTGDFTILCNEAVPNPLDSVRIAEPAPGDVLSITPTDVPSHLTFPTSSALFSTHISIAAPFDPSTIVHAFQFIPVTTICASSTPINPIDATFPPVSTVYATPVITGDASSTPVSDVDSMYIPVITDGVSPTPVTCGIVDATFHPVSAVDARSVSNIDDTSAPVSKVGATSTLVTTDVSSTPVSNVDPMYIHHISMVDASSTSVTCCTVSPVISAVDATSISIVDNRSALVTTMDATSICVSNIDATPTPVSTGDATYMFPPLATDDAASTAVHAVATFDATSTTATSVDTSSTTATSVDTSSTTATSVDTSSTTATSVDTSSTTVDASMIPLASKMRGPSVGVKRKQNSCTSVDMENMQAPSPPARKRRQKAPSPVCKKALREHPPSVKRKGTKRAGSGEIYIDLTTTEDIPVRKKSSKPSCRMSIRKPSGAAAISQLSEPLLLSSSQTSPLLTSHQVPYSSECYIPPPRSPPHLTHCCYLENGSKCGEPVDPQSHRLCEYHYAFNQGLMRFLRLLPPLESSVSNDKPSPKELVELSTTQPSRDEIEHNLPSKMEQLPSSEIKQVSTSVIGQLSPSEVEQMSPAMEQLSPSKIWQRSSSAIGQVSSTEMVQLSPSQMGQISPPSEIVLVSAELGQLSSSQMGQISPPSEIVLVSAELGQLSPSQMGQISPPSEIVLVSAELGQLSSSQMGHVCSGKLSELKLELARLDEQHSSMHLELERLSSKMINIRARAQILLEDLLTKERHVEMLLIEERDLDDGYKMLTTECQGILARRVNLQSSIAEMFDQKTHDSS